MTFYRQQNQQGVTLVELVCTTAVILTLAALTLPVAGTMVKRQKELEFRQTLRMVREALERFQADSERFPGIRTKYLNATNAEGYPEELKWLWEGVDIGDAAGTTIKYLRRAPLDPLTGEDEWETRSTRDGPDALFTDGVNIFDIVTTSEKVGLNGVPYKQW
jgi:general secretion pathway protein G